MTRKGIGTLLVEQLLDEARELEIEQVFLFTYEPQIFRPFWFYSGGTPHHASEGIQRVFPLPEIQQMR